MRLATETVVRVVQDGVTEVASSDFVTKVPTGFRVAQSSTATAGATKLEATTRKAATETDATAQDSMGTGSLRENEECYIIQKPFGQPHENGHAVLRSEVCPKLSKET